ncbi:uncharacterized protein LOC120838916 [Ixodes scapularis]|uniref:uncharacterized protein LOC120838916 n=1 Tax=Ixodes scapularis TaxID=6945 RepID=UPI001C3901E0|nr:uncharacterized protein LOC120838916 [Ixodes scapularis]
MAWTMNAVLLCLALTLTSVKSNIKKAEKYVYHVSHAIRLLFFEPKEFYVVGGTFRDDPLLPPAGMPFKCGKVRTNKIIKGSHTRDTVFSLNRQSWSTKVSTKWYEANYNVTFGRSRRHAYFNYMKLYNTFGNKTFRGSMYLLLSDFWSCALFYHRKSDKAK